MGGGLKNEKLLCILPWPEPKENIARIREKYPGLEIEYIQQAYVPGKLHAGIPEGEKRTALGSDLQLT